MSLLREMAGRSWLDWLTPDEGESSNSSYPASPTTARSARSDEVTPNSSRSHSPRPPTPCADDVMKLPKKDMHIFGLCPVQDDFVLVVCDCCGSSVKMEAFASHVKLRHGSRAAAVSKSALARVERNLRQCTVDLSKEDTMFGKSESSSLATSSLSTSAAPSSVPSPAGSSSSSRIQGSSGILRPASKTPDKELNVPEPMDVDPAPQFRRKTMPKFPAEEIPDSTTSSTNNVISIPDTEPLPHAMSGDIMAIMGEPTADSTTPTSSQHGGPNNPMINLKVRGDSIVLAPSPGMGTEPASPSSRLKTLVPNNIPEALKSLKPSPSNGGKKGAKTGEGRKPVREYHPDKHCGVWDNDSKRNCTRALTCKSHSVLLKRKIAGRSRPFDELVAAHKKAQAAAAAAAAAAQQQSPQQPSPIPPQPQQVTPTVSVVVSGTATAPLPAAVVTASSNVPIIQQQNSPVIATPNPTTIIHPITVPQRATTPAQNVLNPRKSGVLSPSPLLAKADGYADENLHYTTDHPKPLAVCTFGGRRIGGLVIADRSQFLTRKLVRVAITSNGGIARLSGGHQIGGVPAGFHRIRPRIAQSGLGDNQHIGLIKSGGIIKRTQGGNLARALQPPATINLDSGGNYLVNYSNLSVKRTAAPATVGGVNLSTLQPGIHSPSMVIPSDSFKTDIQDFKGGIKFERGRKIKHILPSGSEITQ